ncbi:putative Reticulon [Trypanosoma vivax]|uniref:Reticulon-like protein n=1 Tax=Trypanosoma vivax (strain Y486) TaxID=1055687 RepID=G0TX51_TRYVY|nr:putative Reticulon [Trypanosoma vivax]CCC48541.1 reticulon domain protein [Trypanosoma vivax Y486]
MVCLVSEYCCGMKPCDVLLWRRPPVTGAIFGTLLITISLFMLMEYTIVTFTCRVLQLLLATGFTYSLTKGETITEDDIYRAVDKFVECLAPVLTKALQRGYHIVMWRDRRVSACVLLFSISVGMLGNLLSDMMLLFTTIVFLFTAPIAYEKNKSAVDSFLLKMKETVNEHLGSFQTRFDSTRKRE